MNNAFVQQLIDNARRDPNRIVLPEGRDERVLRAAADAARLGIATCLFLEDQAVLEEHCAGFGIEMNDGMRSFDAGQRLEAYLQELVERRRRKGVSADQARSMLDDPQIRATMMVATGDADGLVSGAVTYTADVLRPALQLIGKSDEEPLVSSFFFMCFRDGPKLFADCALNTSPGVDQLAAIANQSARTAEQFGLDPKVAMLSYSTGTSGSGPERRSRHRGNRTFACAEPGLRVEGPIQYDAAVDPRIARGKMPDSDVAGAGECPDFSRPRCR